MQFLLVEFYANNIKKKNIGFLNPNSSHNKFTRFIKYNNYNNLYVYRIQVSGNPRNNPMLEMTFLTVEHLTDDFKWNVVATDANWETE